MKILLSASILIIMVSSLSAAPQTMRLDYYHTGNAKQETFSIDRVVIEPLPWPGDTSKNGDQSSVGVCLFEVY